MTTCDECGAEHDTRHRLHAAEQALAAYRERDDALEGLTVASTLPEQLAEKAGPLAAARLHRAVEAVQALDPRHRQGCPSRAVPVREAECRCLPRVPKPTKKPEETP